MASENWDSDSDCNNENYHEAEDTSDVVNVSNPENGWQWTRSGHAIKLTNRFEFSSSALISAEGMRGNVKDYMPKSIENTTTTKEKEK